jgi:hypothetical protein
MQRSLSFDYESELVAALKRHLSWQLLQDLLARQQFLFFEELQVGMRIPDLIVIDAPSDYKEDAVSSGVSQLESTVLAELCNHGPQGLRSIADAIFTREWRILDALSRLLKSGLVAEEAPGAFRATCCEVVRSPSIVSIEVKLTDWRRAIDQAKSYLSFSDYSLIALPAPIAGRPAVLTECKNSGIGLIAVELESADIIVPPIENEYFDGDRFWLISKVSSFRCCQ